MNKKGDKNKQRDKEKQQIETELVESKRNEQEERSNREMLVINNHNENIEKI